jgi:hypothetical protein
MGCSEFDPATKERRPWNTGRRLGAKRALKPQQVWAIRFWLDRERRLRDRAMFDLAIDSKLRWCDVVKIKIGDLVSGGRVRSRAIVVQQKTGRGRFSSNFLSPPEAASSLGLNIRRYARGFRPSEPDRSRRSCQPASMPGSLTNG